MTKDHPQNKASEKATIDKDYQRLRTLILGDNYEKTIKEITEKGDIQWLTDIIGEAFHQRNQQDDSLSRQMTPMVESAIEESIKSNPRRITNVIFPIMGPAVRKAVANALADMVYSLNHILQQSLTARSLIWRIKAWRSNISYGQYVLLQNIQYRVEQIFLIHRETGLLLNSTSASGISHQDPDLVSAMLSAISDFINDSFQQEQTLNVIQFGELSLLIESGPFAVLAFAVRGNTGKEVKQCLIETLENIHKDFSHELENFNGNTKDLAACEPTLNDALIQQFNQPERSKPWGVLVLLTLFALLFIQLGYVKWQKDREINNHIAIIKKEPGYQYLAHKTLKDKVLINVLRSPSSITTKQLKSKLSIEKTAISIITKTAIMEDPQLFIPILQQKYGSLEKNRFSSQKNELVIQGNIHLNTLEKLKKDPITQSLFSSVNIGNATILINESKQAKYKNQITQLIQKTNNQSVYFKVASDILKDSSLPVLNQIISNIKMIEKLQSSAGIKMIQIGIIGVADQQGGKLINQELSEKRALLVESILKSNNINHELIVSWGVGAKDLDSVPNHMQRRVNIQILYSELAEENHDK
ncbi:hypothetical protein [Aliikangiella sp. IMCC44359]|uniref:hypothetical protein n=1 Tax=Aliikangiella sp. IMCC44359 TaxID=3459125 RepID=UPI00403AB12E